MDDGHCLSASLGIVGAPFSARFGAAMFAKIGIIANLFSPVLVDRAGACGGRVLVVIRSRCDSLGTAPTTAKSTLRILVSRDAKRLTGTKFPYRILFLQAVKAVFRGGNKSGRAGADNTNAA
jgi:hypothetical protein